MITVEIGEEIHHLISVDPYASTLRVSRIGNLLGFNVNQDNNLVSAPSVEPSSFKKNHQVAYTDLPEQDKQRIAKAAIQKSQTQFHKGDHSFEKPEAGVISYEKKLVQDMAEIEHEILAMSEEAGKCLGQTQAGREQVKDMVKGKLTGLQERIKADLFEFQPAPGEQPTVERFLAKVDYDYHMRK